ncbi:Rho guanine nucleotide exchange factor 1 [Acropora cervicornis]|uniref:Rho guanine nucleotide exchange factor 1 n=1 Tax=Acropora cervicornis TaxID=6130 RepID=A0AAD9R627_ACRCE|nr:Rho guanine nucleotide exchange factor 1 [Acropora cervicornis]
MEPAENQEGQHLIQHCVIIQRDEKGYGLTVTGDNPVYVQSVKEEDVTCMSDDVCGTFFVNGTLVTHFNHAEVVDLIKSGSYVALTLLGKPPAHLHENKRGVHKKAFGKVAKRGKWCLLPQVLLFFVFGFQLAESTTRIKTAEAQLNALMQAQPNFSNNGPFSAPPGKTVPPVWQSVTQIPSRCHSVPAGDSVEQDPNALYDNYPLSAIIPNSETADKGPQRSSTPPLPPERKFVPSGDQLGIREGSGHSRQGSSPAAFYRSSPNGSQQDKTFHTSSLPMAWTPHNPEKQALQLSALTGKGNFYNTGSPPTPSSVHEPMERRNLDDFVEMANERDDSNRAGVIHPSPSCNSIMSMEDDDFASDDEKIDDHGPFNGLELLKNKPGRCIIVSITFFWLVTDSYKEGTPKEMKKWFYEIYSTFLADRAQQGNSTNVLDRCSSFTRKENKILFKIKSSKKSKGHHFVSTHYTSLTFCNHCNGLLWGIGDQGYQCSTCEYNVHKGNCFEAIEDCPGPKKKRKPIPATVSVPAFNPRKPSQPSTTKSNNNNWNSESQDEDQETQNGVDSKSKRSSLDGDSISSGKDIRSEIDSSRSIDREHLSSGDQDGMPRYRSESCLDKPPPTKNIARAETMREFRTTRELGPSMKKKRKSAITMDSSSNSDSFLARGDSTLMDPLSEDEEELDPDMTVDAQPPPWQQIVDKKILRKLKTKEIKRQEFIHELIHTERTHVRNLKVLSKVFYKPMLKMNAMFKQEINQLFPNLDALMQIHVSLMGSMMKRQKEEGDVITRIGDVLLERFDGEPGEIAKDACVEFCKNQKLALEQLRNRRKKEFKLEQFITSCENDPLCRRLRLQDIISSSYQRFTKYPLLLEGIQTNTPNSHVDSKNIERAIKCTKDLLAFVNQSVKDCENQQKLADLQKKIDRRSIESTNNKTMEEFKDLDLTKKKLVYDGDLTWRISRTKSVDLHVLLLEDLLILLQKQDDKYVLKCLSTTVIAGYQDTKTTHSPIIKLNGVLARNVATDKRAFFLVSTSATVGPQIYELVTATVTDRKNWYKYITDTAEAFKVKERGRRDAFSVGGQQRAMDVNEINEIPSKSPVKEEEESVDRDKLVGTNADEEEREKATDLDEDDDSDEIDVKNNEEEEDVDEEEEEDETESEAPTTPEEAPATKMAERPLRLESQADILNQASLAQLTNEESVDDRSLSTERNSVISDSSSSSSNDTMKIRGSLPNMQSEEQFDSPSTPSFRSSVMLLELLRSKDEELRRTLEEKSRLVAELRSNINSDSMEARDLILAAILQANRLTVAVSDVLNPNVDDMSRGMGYDGVNAVFSPQQQLVSSTSVLNEQLTTLLSVITDRDMARERLRCDLQYANSQIQRYKQGRSSSRRPRELPGSQFSLNDDNLSGGFHSDSPRPSSPTSTIDLDSDANKYRSRNWHRMLRRIARGLQWVPFIDDIFSGHVALSRGISNSTMAARRSFYHQDLLERRRGRVRVPIANIDQ